MFNNYEPPSAVPATNLCGTPLYSYITKKKIKHTVQVTNKCPNDYAKI